MKKCLLTPVLFLILTLSFSQTLLIDLGSIKPSEEKKMLFDGKEIAKIIISNAFPNQDYILDIQIEKKLPPPLPDIDLSLPAAAPAAACSTLQAAFVDAGNYIGRSDKTEIVFAKKIASIRDLLNVADGCNDINLLDKVKNFVAGTSRDTTLLVPVRRHSGEDVIITVTRGDNIWKFRIEGDPVGQWLVSYGFAFSSMRSNQEYFTESMPDTSAFRINRKSKYDALDLARTTMIFFSFIPYKYYNRAGYFSITAGLGFDDSVTPYLGLGYFFRQNLGISAGAVIKQVPKLKGMYEEGQVVTENLDFDQLHDETGRLLFSFALSYRFKDNPFKKGKGEQE